MAQRLNGGGSGPLVIGPGKAPPIGWNQAIAQGGSNQPPVAGVNPQGVATAAQHPQIPQGIVGLLFIGLANCWLVTLVI